jgi:CRP/FNR family transcriptional regulator, cyclic AMP receptor protein
MLAPKLIRDSHDLFGSGGRCRMEESKLKTVGLFAGLPRGVLRRLSSMTDEIVVPAGTRLIDEGTFAHEFLLIEAGTADVRRGGELLAQLGPGDFAGEIGVLRDARRNATVAASTELTAIVMTARDLRQVAKELPSVAAQIDAAVAARSATPGTTPPD